MIEIQVWTFLVQTQGHFRENAIELKYIYCKRLMPLLLASFLLLTNANCRGDASVFQFLLQKLDDIALKEIFEGNGGQIYGDRQWIFKW